LYLYRLVNKVDQLTWTSSI